MFRRRDQATVQSGAPESAPAAGDLDHAIRGVTPKKGRATPKRREAEKGRRQPVTAPRNRKEAYRSARTRQQSDRVNARQAAARGDDRYLPSRDKGPVRRLARDYIDARRTLSQYFMWASLAIVVIGMAPIPALKAGAYLIWIFMIAAVVLECVVNARRIKKMAAERLPDEPARGVGLYVAMRSAQIRRFRMPAPRVDIGDKI